VTTLGDRDGFTVTIRAHLDGVPTPNLLREVIGAAEALRELVDEALPVARTEVMVVTSGSALCPVPVEPEPVVPIPLPVPSQGLVIDLARHVVSVDGAEIPTTHKEFGLLAFLASSGRRVYTRGQLLAAVWGLPNSDGIGERTVDVHILRLRRKLGSAGAHISTVRGVGYRWDGAAGQHLLLGRDVA